VPFARAADKVRIYYEAHGSGTPLVLAYGIGGNAEMWDVNRDALAARHRLILWEPRGHARSDSPEDPAKYSFERWVLDLKAVLDRLGIRKAHVGGLSLGAGIATRFALRFPSRVRSLVVTNSSSAAGLPLSVENLVMRARSIEITLTKGMDAMAEYAMVANPNLSERLALDPGARAEFYEEYRRLSPIGYANSLRALLQMDYITDRLPEIRVPTLLVCGDQDPSRQPMRVMEQKVKDARVVLLSPAGHFANRDQPDAFNDAVLRFLGDVSP